MVVGRIVRSMAGHDKESFYLVVRAENGFAWIADGRRRKLCSPKRKNVHHLQKTAKIFPVDETLTDKKLRHLLWELNFGNSQLVTEKEET